MSTTRAARADRPMGLRRDTSPRTRARILQPGSIPTVKSLVAGADALSKKDTFDLTRGHLSHLPGMDQNDEMADMMNGKAPKPGHEELNWPRSKRSHYNLPKLAASLNIVTKHGSEAKQLRHTSATADKFEERITTDDVREALKYHGDYKSVKGLTHQETKRHIGRQMIERNKKLQLKMPNLSQGFESQEPGQYLIHTNQAMSKMAEQNQVFGQVIENVQKTYNDYINQLHKAEAKTNQHFEPLRGEISSAVDGTGSKCPAENLEDLAKHAHQLELDALVVVQKISDINEEISIEKNRVREEKVHFDKYKFLHHDKPIFKARSNLCRDLGDMTDIERMNSDLHEVVALVNEYKALEDNIRARSDDKKSILKADYNRTKSEYDDLELQVVSQTDQLTALEQEQNSLQKSCLFFLETLKNKELQQEYEQIVAS